MFFDMLYALLSIDVKTLVSLLFWGNLTSIALVYSYQISSKDLIDQKLSKNFLLAKIFQASAFFLIFFREMLPDFLSVNLGNTCLFIGFYFESIAILTSINQMKSIWIYIINTITVISILIFNIVELVNPHSSLRVPIASLCVFSILIIPAVKLLTAHKTSNLKKTISIYYIGFLIFLLPRAVYTVFYPEMDIFTNMMIQSVTFLALALLMIFSLSAYLLLMKENTDNIIKYMATTDLLTSIPNRQSFLNSSHDIFEKSKLNQIMIALLFLDIDHFKKINDTYGHSFGDEVLVKLAQVICTNLRQSDLSCRYGGEEFLVFLSIRDNAAAYEVAHRIIEGIHAIKFEQYPDFSFTVSIGVAYGVPGNKDVIMDYINKADRALYEAKNTGRNKIVQYPLHD